MGIAERLRNPFVQQYLIEIVFPLLGYFFFDWNLLTIGVYYLVDHLCSQILFFRRAHWVNTRGNFGKGLEWLLLSIGFFLVIFSIETVLLGYFFMGAREVHLSTVFQTFTEFAKSELWLLIPVVLFVYHFKDQFTFYMPRHYLKFSFTKLVASDLMGNAITVILLALLGFLWMHFKWPDILVILIFLIVKIGYDLTLKKRLLKHALKD